MHIDKTKFGPWALVTGASSGIGKEFSRQLAANGLNVVLVARRLELLKELGQDLEKEFGVQCQAVQVDLSDENFIGEIKRGYAGSRYRSCRLKCWHRKSRIFYQKESR